MSDYLTLLQAVARVAGGSNPTNPQILAAHPEMPSDLYPYWFSGLDHGNDGTGVAGLVGCFALPSEIVGPTPVGMLVPNRFDPATDPRGGQKIADEQVALRVMVGRDDMATQALRLVKFRDIVPAQFDLHMSAFGEPGVYMLQCDRGRFIELDWGGAPYMAWEFTIFVRRAIAASYAN